MPDYYLDFEKPIKELDDKIASLKSIANPNVNDKASLNTAKQELNNIIKDIHSSLTRWQRIQLARHPDRPYSLDYINYLSSDFIELHGDRHFADDSAIIAGLGHLDKFRVAFNLTSALYQYIQINQ